MTTDEFLDGAADPPDLVTRRRFLEVTAASAVLAAGCARAPREEIVPFARSPEGVVPGKPRYYATSLTLAGIATGVLVEQRDGRPVKIEGNPDHPASLGATDAFTQAELLGLYDPDRSAAVTHNDRPSDWGRAVAAFRAAVEAQRPKRGAGLRVLTGAVTSPTLAHQIDLLLKELPEARWHQYEPVGCGERPQGARAAFGADVDAVYRLDRADVVLSLDADFLASGPGHLRYARDFADRRRVWDAEPAQARMNRLYAVGPTPTPTSAVADHRLAVRAADVAGFARAVAARLGVATGGEPTGRFPEDWLTAVADDRGGKPAAANALKGAIMRETKGSVRADVVERVLREELDRGG